MTPVEAVWLLNVEKKPHIINRGPVGQCLAICIGFFIAQICVVAIEVTHLHAGLTIS